MPEAGEIWFAGNLDANDSDFDYDYDYTWWGVVQILGLTSPEELFLAVLLNGCGTWLNDRDKMIKVWLKRDQLRTRFLDYGVVYIGVPREGFH
jgi:hypothetical protein